MNIPNSKFPSTLISKFLVCVVSKNYDNPLGLTLEADPTDISSQIKGLLIVPPSVRSSPRFATNSSGVKLPKLDIPTFDGNVTYRKQLWDHFLIHDHNNLSSAENIAIFSMLSRKGHQRMQLRVCHTLRKTATMACSVWSHNTIVHASSTAHASRWLLTLHHWKKVMEKNWGNFTTMFSNMCAL